MAWTSIFWDLQWAAKLHDIGKICIPDAIVHKPRLTTEEYATSRASRLAGVSSVPSTPQPHLPIILHHHERFRRGR
jgi:response regulator RpfG family c-di-GMP phosphodiesterase